jgi:hypothetical protein
MRKNDKMQWLAAVAISLAAIAGVTPTVEAAGCAQVVVGSEQLNKGQFTSSFSASSILDVDISATFVPGTTKRFESGNHVVEVRVYTPHNYLYQTISVPFTADPKRTGQTIRLEGYPHPLPIQQMRTVKQGNSSVMAVSARLPVGGTMISANSLYGVWTAQVYVDGETLPCSQAAKFTVTP